MTTAAPIAATPSLGSGATLDPANHGDALTRAVTNVNVTSSTVPDFFVALLGADHTGAVVVTDVGGTWHALAVHHASGSPELVDAAVSGSTVTESLNDCQPSCATGKITTTAFRYSPSADALGPRGWLNPAAHRPASVGRNRRAGREGCVSRGRRRACRCRSR